MAVRILKSELNNDQINIILKTLCFSPKQKGNPKYTKYKNASILLFYLVTPTEIIVPYIFGNCLLQKNINLKNSYSRINLTFKLKLKSDQEIIAKEAWEQLYN